MQTLENDKRIIEPPYGRLILLTMLASLACFFAIAFLPFLLLPAATARETTVPSMLFPRSPISVPRGTASGSEAQSSGGGSRLVIGNPATEVPLCFCDLAEGAEAVQAIVDEEDLAACFSLEEDGGRKISVIADHDGQAFAALFAVFPGAGCSIFPENGGREDYICTWAGTGTNAGSTLLLSDGTDIRDLQEDTLVLYTCRGDWEHVTITLWQKLTADCIRAQNPVCCLYAKSDDTTEGTERGAVAALRSLSLHGLFFPPGEGICQSLRADRHHQCHPDNQKYPGSADCLSCICRHQDRSPPGTGKHQAVLRSRAPESS